MLTSFKGNRSLLLSLLAVVAMTVLMSAPALAITNGTPDGNGHPYVGLMVAKDSSGAPLWRCSGTLMSDRIFVTAGHCTAAPAASAEIWFDAGPIPLGDGYPSTRGRNTCTGVSGYPCTGDASGKVYTHPDYDPDRFFFRDLGVVKLNGSMSMAVYGELPELDQLDSLSAGAELTAVGYGVQSAFPDPAAFLEEAVRIRMVAEPALLQINSVNSGDYSLLLSTNASGGGTCFGDSGGPNFLGDSTVVAGVSSFVITDTCKAFAGAFRLDRSWSLDWLATFGL